MMMLKDFSIIYRTPIGSHPQVSCSLAVHVTPLIS